MDRYWGFGDSCGVVDVANVWLAESSETILRYNNGLMIIRMVVCGDV